MDVAPPSLGDQEVARLLALLHASEGNPLTIAAMRRAGVTGPAQAIYTLQLTGHEIDRVYCSSDEGRKTLGYRLFAGEGDDRQT
jgi:hypothetical protein